MAPSEHAVVILGERRGSVYVGRPSSPADADESSKQLTTLSRRMLSVASPLDVEALRAGICRAHEVARVPTAAALAEFYRAQPSFEIDAGVRVRPLRL